MGKVPGKRRQRINVTSVPKSFSVPDQNHISGCGSVLNVKGEVEMDALVMDGRTLGSGAVSAVRNIANPIQLARLVMDKVCQGCRLN